VYITKMKGFSSELAAAGRVISDVELKDCRVLIRVPGLRRRMVPRNPESGARFEIGDAKP
jgi:hypothetical protein